VLDGDGMTDYAFGTLGNTYMLDGVGYMNTSDIIIEIDAQISLLLQAKALLVSGSNCGNLPCYPVLGRVVMNL